MKTRISGFAIGVVATVVGLTLVGCLGDDDTSVDGTCCRLAAISVCDCNAISWVTGAEEAIASDDPATCQLMIDTILDNENYATPEQLCEMEGNLGCYTSSNQTCTSGSSFAGTCCLLAALSTCDCVALSWVTVAEEAIASGNQRTCKAVFDEVLDNEGYASAQQLCDSAGDFGCWMNAESTCH